MKNTVENFVTAYVADMADTAFDLDRAVTESSGLGATEMMAVLTDTRLGRMGIPLMADFMAPDGSVYFDAIFGAFHGQAAIRNWLVPAMAEIEFVDFVPTAESVIFDDGMGGSSLDEWNMVANIGDMSIPLARGVSVRRYRDGWITWACDVYDTGAMRLPPPPDMGVEAAPLPPWPNVDWVTDQSAAAAQPNDVGSGPILCADSSTVSEQIHPTDFVYFDSLFGEFRGRSAVESLLADVGPKFGQFVAEPLGARLFDGTVSVQEWKLMAIVPDGRRELGLRGTSVRRFADGLVTYAADYFDTAPFADDAVKAIAQAAGSTLSSADIAEHRAVI